MTTTTTTAATIRHQGLLSALTHLTEAKGLVATHQCQDHPAWAAIDAAYSAVRKLERAAAAKVSAETKATRKHGHQNVTVATVPMSLAQTDLALATAWFGTTFTAEELGLGAESIGEFRTEQGYTPRCYAELDAWSQGISEWAAYTAANPTPLALAAAAESTPTEVTQTSKASTDGTLPKPTDDVGVAGLPQSQRPVTPKPEPEAKPVSELDALLAMWTKRGEALPMGCSMNAKSLRKHAVRKWTEEVVVAETTATMTPKTVQPSKPGTERSHRELQVECKAKGLKANGSTHDLLVRLTAHADAAKAKPAAAQNATPAPVVKTPAPAVVPMTPAKTVQQRLAEVCLTLTDKDATDLLALVVGLAKKAA